MTTLRVITKLINRIVNKNLEFSFEYYEKKTHEICKKRTKY